MQSVLPESLRPSKRTLVLILAVASITLLISTGISILLTRTGNLSFPSLGNVKTYGVLAYWDANLQNQVDVLDWGTISVGSSANETIYLQSISTIDATLTLTKANLTFYDAEAVAIQPPTNMSDYMTLSWNYDGSVLAAGDDIQTTLTLSIEDDLTFILYLVENAVDGFNFDVIIHATEPMS